jgi:N-acetylglutamate synthase-like GNAT family acetyltransferase
MCQPDDPTAHVRLRKAHSSDAALILWLEEVCMREYATALWGKWHAAETFDLANHEMIELQGKAQGCLATHYTPEALQLSRLYLSPNARNRGVGAQVLAEVIDRAERKQLPVTLSVLTTNPAARFYERHGFSVFEETLERLWMIRPYMPIQGE